MLTQETADAISESIGTVGTFVAPLNPIIPFILGLVGAAIQQEPKVEATLRALFTKESVTAADFDAAIAHIEGATYEKLVPASDLPHVQPALTPVERYALNPDSQQPAPAPDLEPKAT